MDQHRCQKKMTPGNIHDPLHLAVAPTFCAPQVDTGEVNYRGCSTVGGGLPLRFNYFAVRGGLLCLSFFRNCGIIVPGLWQIHIQMPSMGTSGAAPEMRLADAVPLASGIGFNAVDARPMSVSLASWKTSVRALEIALWTSNEPKVGSLLLARPKTRNGKILWLDCLHRAPMNV